MQLIKLAKNFEQLTILLCRASHEPNFIRCLTLCYCFCSVLCFASVSFCPFSLFFSHRGCLDNAAFKNHRNCKILQFCFDRMTIKELGLSDAVLDSLAQRLSRKPSELKVCTYWQDLVMLVSIIYYLWYQKLVIV